MYRRPGELQIHCFESRGELDVNPEQKIDQVAEKVCRILQNLQEPRPDS